MINKAATGRSLWTKESTYWLMEEIKLFEMREEKHQIKKRAVYEELAEKFTESNFPISWEAVQKKWQNLMSMYWKNVKRENPNQWEYFMEMDKILRNTTVWVGLNGCKDPSQANSLHYNDQSGDRFWSTERILHLMEEMKHINRNDDGGGGITRRNIFHRIALNFNKLGVDIDWKSIQKKWHNLMATYKRNLRKPRDEIVWEFFDTMASVIALFKTVPNSDVTCSYEFSNEMHQQNDGVERNEQMNISEETLWTEDNTLLLMEEMFAVKERKDKHQLNNSVVFREIANIFQEEGVQIEWRQVLKKWQSMYVSYSKVMRGVMRANLWPYFERMHCIVGDTDMYVGVGSKKQTYTNHLKTADRSFVDYSETESAKHTQQYVFCGTSQFNGDNSNNDQLFIFNAEDNSFNPYLDGDIAAETVATNCEYVVAGNVKNEHGIVVNGGEIMAIQLDSQEEGSIVQSVMENQSENTESENYSNSPLILTEDMLNKVIVFNNGEEIGVGENMVEPEIILELDKEGRSDDLEQRVDIEFTESSMEVDTDSETMDISENFISDEFKPIKIEVRKNGNIEESKKDKNTLVVINNGSNKRKFHKLKSSKLKK